MDTLKQKPHGKSTIVASTDDNNLAVVYVETGCRTMSKSTAVAGTSTSRTVESKNSNKIIKT